MSTNFSCAANRESLLLHDEGRSSTFPDQRRRSPRLLNIMMEAAELNNPPKSPSNHPNKKFKEAAENKPPKSPNQEAAENKPPKSPNQIPKKRAKNNSVQKKKKKIEHSLVTLDVTSSDHKDRLTECATLAMWDHAIQLDYDIELTLLKLLKASYNKDTPDVFIITFRASSEMRGTQTFEAHVSDNIYARRVIKVRKIRKLSKDKWYTGILGIPHIEVCVKENKEEVEKSPPKLPWKRSNQPNKKFRVFIYPFLVIYRLYYDFHPYFLYVHFLLLYIIPTHFWTIIIIFIYNIKFPCVSTEICLSPCMPLKLCHYFDVKSLDPDYKKQLTEYAILAMKDHAIQLEYYSGLQFNQLLSAYYVSVAGQEYVITFEAESLRHGVQIFEAHVYNCLSMLQVVQVKTLSPTKSKWYTGTLGIPNKE